MHQARKVRKKYLALFSLENTSTPFSRTKHWGFVSASVTTLWLHSRLFHRLCGKGRI